LHVSSRWPPRCRRRGRRRSLPARTRLSARRQWRRCATDARCCSATAASCGWWRSSLHPWAGRCCKDWPPVRKCGTIGADHDRYGRLAGFVFAGKATRSLQVALLEAGAARVGVPVGSRACAEALLAAEQAARAAELGSWADPNFAPLAAKNVHRLEAERGQFTLVEGKVLSVRTSAGTICISFGRRWTRDFSVVVLRRRQKAFAAAGVHHRQLEGRRIRVRRWIEQRRGPVIEAEWPEQIELIH